MNPQQDDVQNDALAQLLDALSKTTLVSEDEEPADRPVPIRKEAGLAEFPEPDASILDDAGKFGSKIFNNYKDYSNLMDYVISPTVPPLKLWTIGTILEKSGVKAYQTPRNPVYALGLYLTKRFHDNSDVAKLTLEQAVKNFAKNN